MVVAIAAREILLDYSKAYLSAWGSMFGGSFENKNANANDLRMQWNQERLTFNDRRKFLACLDHNFWAGVPESPGAVDACNLLNAQGISIHVLLDISERYKHDVSDNLASKGLPFSDLHILPRSDIRNDLRQKLLDKIRASAVVDGHLPNFRGISGSVHKALITGKTAGNRNSGFELASLDSMHPAVGYFSDWWIKHRAKSVQL